jgi:DNA-binding LacI/PurR family transcriptional regulator
MDMPIDEKVITRLTDRLPAVVIGGLGQGLPGVVADDVGGGRLAGEQLATWGHRRVAFVRETQVTFFPNSPTHLRYEGLVSALGAKNVIDISMARDESGGADAVRQLFAEEDRSRWPTAIFATRDLVALKVWRAAREFGLRVPEDLSVIGFDDDATVEAMGLTTIRNPLEETGAEALRMLQRCMRGDRVVDVTLPVSLVERTTAGPVSADLG